jgi:hypothetical protein
MRNAPGVSPRSIIVTGSNFENIDSVLINGMTAPEFVVTSRTSLIAQVPADIEDAVLTDVAVLCAVPSYTGRSLVEMTLGSKIRAISGTQRMMQNFVRLLLRTPGSNIFNKTSGGGLPQRIGSTLDNRVAADIAVAVASTKQYIIAAQTPERTIPNDERLLSAEIANLTVDAANASVYVTIILTSHAGARSAATLVA